MDDELKDLFFDAIDHFPLEQRDAAQRCFPFGNLVFAGGLPYPTL